MNASGQIANAFKAVLTGLTTTGAKAYRARSLSLGEANLPAILINLGADSLVEDELSGLSDGGLGETWVQEVSVVALTKAVDSEVGEDTLLLIKSEIEVALFTDPTLGISIKYLEITSVSAPEISTEGEKTGLSIEINCAATYRIKQGVPDAIIN